MSLEDKFSIEDGVIKATNDGGKGDNLLTEKSDYKNFVFKLSKGNIDDQVELSEDRRTLHIRIEYSGQRRPNTRPRRRQRVNKKVTSVPLYGED